MACQCRNIDHLFEPPCSLVSQFNTAQLIMACNAICRGRFFVRCHRHQDQTRPCHHFRVVYTDGACANNGTSGAVSGIGIAFVTSEGEEGHQFSIPVDDNIDPGGKRTSQRAELLAALEGLKKIGDRDAGFFAYTSKTRPEGTDAPEIVITTDSEYVVKGMTEWFPTWKVVANNLLVALTYFSSPI